MNNSNDYNSKKLLSDIDKEGFGPCYICWELTGIVRLSNRFCHNCDEWFCPEHGSFRGGGKGYCLMHDSVLNKIANENLISHKEK